MKHDHAAGWWEKMPVGYRHHAYRICQLCGGQIGPDVLDLPTCYTCGPADMVPENSLTEALTAAYGDRWRSKWRTGHV